LRRWKRAWCELFHRVGRGVELTEAAPLFLVEPRRLARVEAAGLVLSELAT